VNVHRGRAQMGSRAKTEHQRFSNNKTSMYVLFLIGPDNLFGGVIQVIFPN